MDSPPLWTAFYQRCAALQYQHHWGDPSRRPFLGRVKREERRRVLLLPTTEERKERNRITIHYPERTILRAPERVTERPFVPHSFVIEPLSSSSSSRIGHYICVLLQTKGAVLNNVHSLLFSLCFFSPPFNGLLSLLVLVQLKSLSTKIQGYPACIFKKWKKKGKTG